MIVGIASSGTSPPAPTITISPTTLTTPTPGVYYSQNIEATGGYTPYSWYWDGTLPTGLSLVTSGTGVRLQGTPVSGTYTFTIIVADVAGYTASQEYTLSYYNTTPSFDYLIVGGGGSGGGGGTRTNPVVYMTGGGGGGGGGLRTGSTTITGAGTQVSLTVGAGGAQVFGFANGKSGTTSSIQVTGQTAITAAGGGGGAAPAGKGEYYNGINGGCGGGATSGSTVTGVGGTGSIGFKGANVVRASNDTANYPGGGGGGMGSAGSSTSAGGSGISNNFTGTNVTYSAGGNGGFSSTYASGSSPSGIGYGGNGGPSGYQVSGTSLRNGQGGAPGIVIIKYSNVYDLPATITGTYTYQNTGGYHIFSFTDAVSSGTSGSITF